MDLVIRETSVSSLREWSHWKDSNPHSLYEIHSSALPVELQRREGEALPRARRWHPRWHCVALRGSPTGSCRPRLGGSRRDRPLGGDPWAWKTQWGGGVKTQCAPGSTQVLA